MEDDSFCIFLVYMKAVKSRVLEERAELVASQLTQMIYFLRYFYSTYIFVFFIICEKISGGE